MSYILNISTAVPEFEINTDELMHFYSRAFAHETGNRFMEKISFLNKRTEINTRYSCISDYKGNRFELFTDGNFKQPVEKRMELFKKKVMPLAAEAIDKLFTETPAKPQDITHLITVSCTGIFAPGLEFMIAEQYGLQHAEKLAINFLGCYAALKAIKQAHYIAQANPEACILIVCAELCSLHFYPSETMDEDIVANLLFADGAGTLILCGAQHKLVENRRVLQIDDIGTGFITNTAGMMTWDITSSAFRMHLSSKVVNAIGENIQDVVNDFMGNALPETEFWAIHPGGIKIIEAVKEGLQLNENNVADSMNVLRQYGNMSSPTILFILNSIFHRIKKTKDGTGKKIFSCAFGPGLNIEMIRFSSIDTGYLNKLNHSIHKYAVEP